MRLKIFLDPESNQTWAVKVLEAGDRYGLDNCLVNDSGKLLVEFWDTRHPHGDLGQFVSRYFNEELGKREYGVGLNLQGGVPSWSISAVCMDKILVWLSGCCLAKQQKWVEVQHHG